MAKERFTLEMINSMDEETMRQILRNQEIENQREEERERIEREEADKKKEADNAFLDDFMKTRFRNQGVEIKD